MTKHRQHPQRMRADPMPVRECAHAWPVAPAVLRAVWRAWIEESDMAGVGAKQRIAPAPDKPAPSGDRP